MKKIITKAGFISIELVITCGLLGLLAIASIAMMNSIKVSNTVKNNQLVENAIYSHVENLLKDQTHCAASLTDPLTNMRPKQFPISLSSLKRCLIWSSTSVQCVNSVVEIPRGEWKSVFIDDLILTDTNNLIIKFHKLNTDTAASGTSSTAGTSEQITLPPIQVKWHTSKKLCTL